MKKNKRIVFAIFSTVMAAMPYCADFEATAAVSAASPEDDDLLSVDYTIRRRVPQEPKPYRWVRDENINASKGELMSQFSATPSGGTTRYLLKEVKMDPKENDIFFYFNARDGQPEPLRLRVQYFADDQVNFNKMRFKIDGFKYEYTPQKVNHSKEGRFFMENFDEELGPDSRHLVYALAHCKKANVVLVSGSGVSHRLFFREKDLRHFKQVYQLYRLMGGGFDYDPSEDVEEQDEQPTHYAQTQEPQRELTDEEVERLLNTDYSVKHHEAPKDEPLRWIDDEEASAIDNMAELFNVTPNGNSQRYLLKEVKKDPKENDIFFYFNTIGETPQPLRLCVQYFADDQVNFTKMRFKIDGFPYEYTPQKVNHSRDGRFFMENFDEELKHSDRDLVYALAHCKKANVVLVSSSGVSHRLFFREKDLRHFRQVYEMYRAMGGRL